MDKNKNIPTYEWNKNDNWTWEVKNYEYGKWLDQVITVPAGKAAANTIKSKYTVPSPTKESMIEDVLSRTDEKGFFGDVIEWLERDAPRKVAITLNDLHYSSGSITYDRLCEAVYDVGFRANERIERRMMLGSANEWVQGYFRDFPDR